MTRRTRQSWADFASCSSVNLRSRYRTAALTSETSAACSAGWSRRQGGQPARRKACITLQSVSGWGQEWTGSVGAMSDRGTKGEAGRVGAGLG